MATQRLNPGPISGSVLTLQQQHRSTCIWNKNDPGIIHCRRGAAIHKSMAAVDDRMIPYLISSGFYGIHCLKYIKLDHALITALVERWRQETHTFHLAVGEATVTLQDVGVLLGLPVDGQPIITGPPSIDAGSVCERYLGIKPPLDMLSGYCVKMKWLSQTFARLPENADDTMVQQYTRAYILQLIVGILFADRSQNMVNVRYLTFLKDLKMAGEYSWGSAVLAWLYRELCRATSPEALDIVGPLLLLQLWAWERFPHMCPTRKSTPRPVATGLPKQPLGCRWCVELSTKNVSTNVLWVYRDQLDQQKANQMIWEPYDAQVMQELPDYCLSGSHIWRSKCPLICYDIVELHFPDRVLRQFGLHQEIPSPCNTLISLHEDRVGRVTGNWLEHHREWISMWEKRSESIAEGRPSKGPMNKDDPYMIWYNQITRRFIGPLDDGASQGYQGYGARYASMGQVLQSIIDQAKYASIVKDATTYEHLCRYIINMGEPEMNLYHGIESHQNELEEAYIMQRSDSDTDGSNADGDSSDDIHVLSLPAAPFHGSASSTDPSQGDSSQSDSTQLATDRQLATTTQLVIGLPTISQPPAGHLTNSNTSTSLPTADQPITCLPMDNQLAASKSASSLPTGHRQRHRLAGQASSRKAATSQVNTRRATAKRAATTKRAATNKRAATTKWDATSQLVTPLPITSQVLPNYQPVFPGSCYFPMPSHMPPMLPMTSMPNPSGASPSPMPFFWPYPMHPSIFTPITQTPLADQIAPDASKKKKRHKKPSARAKKPCKDRSK